MSSFLQRLKAKDVIPGAPEDKKQEKVEMQVAKSPGAPSTDEQLPVDIYKIPGAIIIYAQLAGSTVDDFGVTIEGDGDIVTIKGERPRSQIVKTGSSYASQSELTLTFGLGEDPRVSRIAVQWPSGRTQSFEDLAPNQAVRIDEGRGLLSERLVPVEQFMLADLTVTKVSKTSVSLSWSAAANAEEYVVERAGADGVFAAIAKRMADNDISLESIVQQAASADTQTQKTVILVTHETTEAAVRKAVEGITKDGHLTDKPQVIRIERAE